MMAASTAVLLLALVLLTVDSVLCQRPGNRKPGGSRTPAAPSPRTTQAPQDSDDLTDECPEPNGYFADGYQCDKYYECIDGAITEKLCPDGMVFNDYNIQVEKCDLPFNIDCSTRSELQKPKPSTHCPRQNGYFAHEDGSICDKFYFCVDGKYNMITCPDGLVYNERTGICTWPDEAKKAGCSSQDVFKFSCPNVTDAMGQTHPRYADPEDCQFFYVCIDGKVPRRNGCKKGQVFNDVTKNCDWPRNVPECKEWYKGILTDAELEALENPKPKNRTQAYQNQASSRRKGATRPQPQHSEDEE
ncbi:protein obstructor-E-like [Macrosteles quadrilineatus]|uniref:protein obstructor-E-like n=1 Tax=Macrosteles quadrilineatus TaxID=74068 RepID=UPI0023E28A4A|nr:protein obstructor-E-like [Macrosteles quadrilineatus]